MTVQRRDMTLRTIVRGLCAAIAAGAALAACKGGVRASADSAAGSIGTESRSVTPPDSAVAWKFVAPPSWSERTRSVPINDSTRGRLYPGARAVEKFDYVPADPKLGAQTLLLITVYDSVTWAKIDAEDGPPVGDVITRDAGNVYVASLPQSNPYPPSNIESKEFEARTVQLEDVKKGFLVVKR